MCWFGADPFRGLRDERGGTGPARRRGAGEGDGRYYQTEQRPFFQTPQISWKFSADYQQMFHNISHSSAMYKYN